VAADSSAVDAWHGAHCAYLQLRSVDAYFKCCNVTLRQLFNVTIFKPSSVAHTTLYPVDSVYLLVPSV